MLWGLALLLVEAPVVCLSSPPGFELLLIVSGPLGTNGRKKTTLPPRYFQFFPRGKSDSTKNYLRPLRPPRGKNIDDYVR